MFKGKSKQNGKKKIVFLLSATMLLSTVFGGWKGFDNPIVYAGTADEEKIYYFAEGFGTGVDFSEDNWKINTTFRVGTPTSITSNPMKYAAIVENEHSGNDEKIIRLINGVRGPDLNRADIDSRAGTALVKDRVPLKESSEFSAKFTISMPDACVNTVQTGGQQFAREAGGDGIAFIITPTDSVNGRVGTGMGYYGVKDSLVIEMDSYFNGAYCTFETLGTEYVNWAYDNQIYANSSLGYLQSIADDTRNKGIEYDWASNGPGYWTTLNNNGYAQLSTSQDRRFDHVGVMLDGVTREHTGISYLNGLQPDMVTGGKYENISNPSASTTSSSKDCATRFADAGNIDVIGEEVDNRLFTFWIEYDGENLYVRYANGNFTDAVRPADPQIKLESIPQLAHKFESDNVQIGFISSIGSSKANHTVHSVAFANKYFENGVQTEYTEKYYVEEPDATTDFITVNSKKYVLTDSVVVENVDIGSEAEIRDKSTETKYQSYIKKDYSSNPLYPDSTLSVKGDGTTVLYQFYDLPSYKIEYWLEVPEATEDSIEVNGKYYVIKSEETMNKYASAGTGIISSENANGAGVKADDIDVEDTFKQFTGYVYNQTATDAHGKNNGDVAQDNSLVIRLLYDLDEEPTTEEPTTEAPTTEKPTTEAPTTDNSTTETPTTEKPTTEAPATDTPTTEAPAKKGAKLTSGKLVYKVSKAATAKKAGTLTVTALSKSGKKAESLSIPATATIKGYKYNVTKLGNNVFKGAKAKSVALGKNIKTIPKGAFANCKKLSTLTIKAKLKSVKKDAFKGCKKTIKVKGSTEKNRKANVKLLKKKSGYKKFK